MAKAKTSEEPKTDKPKDPEVAPPDENPKPTVPGQDEPAEQPDDLPTGQRRTNIF